MALKDITITASINSHPTLSYGQKTYIASTDEQSFPIEVVLGGQAGTWPNFINGTNYTTNLAVNITQSWSGSYETETGIVHFIHNTNEEFFNGEFSGSALEITNGNITDPDCRQFLVANTTLVEYNPYFYNSFYNLGPPLSPINTTALNTFLNVNTSPSNGGVLIHFECVDPSGTSLGPFYYAPTFIKVARIDALGNDNTLSLQELTSFRIRYSGASTTSNYEIVNITEYPDYYFYELSQIGRAHV